MLPLSAVLFVSTVHHGGSWAAMCDDARVRVHNDATHWLHHEEPAWVAEAIAGSMRTPILLDGRHVLDRARVTRAGLRYIGLAG